MTDMVRKQIYITRRQQNLIKRLAKQRGLSEAEIIRQAIDSESNKASAQGLAANEDSWQQGVAFMRSLRERADQFPEAYKWDRKEIYEERLERYARSGPSPDNEK